MHTCIYKSIDLYINVYKKWAKNGSKKWFNQGFVLKMPKFEPNLSQKSGKKVGQNLQINQGFVLKLAQNRARLKNLTLDPPSAC